MQQISLTKKQNVQMLVYATETREIASAFLALLETHAKEVRMLSLKTRLEMSRPNPNFTQCFPC
jgi:hypothetical protein